MPRVTDMFPSKWLKAEELPRGQQVLVTIEYVRPHEAKFANAGNRVGGGGEDVEASWLIKFREFRKMAFLKRPLAQQIGSFLGDDNTDNWGGRQIAIFPTQIMVGGRFHWVIAVAETAVGAQPALAAAAGDRPVVSGQARPVGDTRPIGQYGRDKFLNACALLKTSHDAFLRWLKANYPPEYELCVGRGIDTYPALVLPLMKQYLNHASDRGGDADAEPKPGEQPGAPAVAQQPGKGWGAQPIEDDDIPF